MHRLGGWGVAVHAILLRLGSGGVDAEGAEIEGGEEEGWAGGCAGCGVAGMDPGEVVDGLEFQAVEVVEDGRGGVGCGVDGVDGGGAVGEAEVAGGGEVDGFVEVVAPVGVDVA